MKEFNKVVGYQDIKLELYRILDVMSDKDRYKKLGAIIPKGIILSGPPGTGKTLMAKCFIKASKRKAFVIRKNKSDGDFIELINETFEKAIKNSPAIVLLDDIDKFANEDDKHTDAEEYVAVQSNIDYLEDNDVFVIATCNNRKKLPTSLMREGRLDKSIFIDCPNRSDSEEIVKHYLNNKKVVKGIDYKEISRLLGNRSCASLESVINEAAIFAGYDKRESINMDDFVKAFMRTVYQTPESTILDRSKYLRQIATHEAAHVVVSEVLEPGSVTLVTCDKHEGGTVGGFTSLLNDEDYFESKDFMETRVMSLLAGKAATELIYGIVDVGSLSDVRRASEIVTRFVDDYSGYGFTYSTPCSDIDGLILTDRKSQLIQTEMERYYQKAKKVLIDNRLFLDKVVEELEKNKYLVHKDVQSIKQSLIL